MLAYEVRRAKTRLSRAKAPVLATKFNGAQLICIPNGRVARFKKQNCSERERSEACAV